MLVTHIAYKSNFVTNTKQYCQFFSGISRTTGMNEDRLSNVMEKVRMLVEIDKKNSCSASVRRARLEFFLLRNSS